MSTPHTEEMEHSINFSDYLRVLLKRKWLIIACFVLVLGITTYNTFRTTPIYKATSTMVIENNIITSPVTGEKLDYGGFMTNQVSINTHIQLIKSSAVLENVIRVLGMGQARPTRTVTRAPAYRDSSVKNILNKAKSFSQRVKDNTLLLLGKKEDKPLPPVDRHTQLIRNLSGKVNVEHLQGTNLLHISVWDPDPVKAKELADAVAQAYIEFNASGRLKSSKEMLDWMTAQLYETQKRLEDAEAAFQEFKENQGIFSLEGKRNLISQQISTTNQDYLETRNQRIELETRMVQLQKLAQQNNGVLSGRLLIENDLINTLYTQLLNLEVEMNRMANVYKPKHPKMVQIQTKIEQTRSKMKQELSKELDSLKAKLSLLVSKEEMLKDNMANSEQVALDTNKKEFKYAMLQRNIETNRKLYDTLLGKIEASNIDDNLDVTNIRIVEQAAIPRSPVIPDTRGNTRKGILMGLLLGIGLAFLLEYMDQSIRSEEDVQKYLDLPILALIPKVEKP